MAGLLWLQMRHFYAVHCSMQLWESFFSLPTCSSSREEFVSSREKFVPELSQKLRCHKTAIDRS
jgi:hypothetical protein